MNLNFTEFVIAVIVIPWGVVSHCGFPKKECLQGRKQDGGTDQS